MRIALADALARLPLPATDRWPNGVWDTEAMAHGSMSVILFTPRGADHQSSHLQDEVYIVLKGSGLLRVGDQQFPFGSGDALFVPAGTGHRFEDFTDDLVTWALLWGPVGGENASNRTHARPPLAT